MYWWLDCLLILAGFVKTIYTIKGVVTSPNTYTTNNKITRASIEINILSTSHYHQLQHTVYRISARRTRWQINANGVIIPATNVTITIITNVVKDKNITTLLGLPSISKPAFTLYKSVDVIRHSITPKKWAKSKQRVKPLWTARKRALFPATLSPFSVIILPTWPTYGGPKVIWVT